MEIVLPVSILVLLVSSKMVISIWGRLDYRRLHADVAAAMRNVAERAGWAYVGDDPA